MGKKHGRGVFVWSDGSTYNGEFHNNNVILKKKKSYNFIHPNLKLYFQIDGQGTYSWADGR